MKTLNDKLVAITGAASGMGRALAVECARRGSRLALVDVDVEGLEETAARARAAQRGAQIDVSRLDVADRAAIYAWAARLESALGGADVLINNAGVSLSASVEKMRDEDFEWLFAINFWGVVNGCRAFLPQLRKKPDAHIVNLSSVFGLIGVPTQSAYCASKFAVRGYSESLRQELAESSVRVACVHPGGIRTDIVKRGRHYEDATGASTDTAQVAATFEKNARTSADEAALVILRGVLRDEPRILIGADAHAIDAMARLAPRRYDALVRRAALTASKRNRAV